jgi:uncharacterized protein
MLTVQQIQQTVSAYFKDKPVKKVYLFGSYARGEATEDSDVDLLVEFDDSKKRLSLFDVLSLKIGLEGILNKEVQLIEEAEVYKGFKPYIEHDKMQIYAA